MPSLTEITKNRKTGFKKREYRPWNIDGYGNTVIPDNAASLVSSDNQETISSDHMIEINPDLIKNWDFNDRPSNELGDIEALAAEFKEIGQQQPCIVRPYDKDTQYQFELIVGERRWCAAKLALINLKAIVKPLSDSEAAIIQASENLNRKDLSDYARGMSYFNLIDKGIIEQKDLIDKLQLSKQQVSRLLSFSRIPEEIIIAIQDMSKVSSRTAEQIKQLANKGREYIDALIKFADKITLGKLGHEKLTHLVENEVANNANATFALHSENEKIYGNNGKAIYTWRFNKEAGFSINFPRHITALFHQNKTSRDTLNKLIKEYMEEILK